MKRQDIGRYKPKFAVDNVNATASEVWGYQDIRQSKNLFVSLRRLVRQNINGSEAEHSILQTLNQRSLIDDRSASCVD